MVEMRIGTVAFVSLLALAACESKQETPSAEPAEDTAASAEPEAKGDTDEKVGTEADADGEETAKGDDAKAEADDAEAKADDEAEGSDAAEADATTKKVAGAEPAPATPSPTAKPEADKAKPKGPVVGKQATITASVQAEGGYHCNKEYPHKFVTEGGSNVTYPVARPKGACAGDKAIAVAIPYIPQAAGPGEVAGTMRYGICDDGGTNCMIKKRPMTLKFTASAP